MTAQREELRRPQPARREPALPVREPVQPGSVLRPPRARVHGSPREVVRSTMAAARHPEPTVHRGSRSILDVAVTNRRREERAPRLRSNRSMVRRCLDGRLMEVRRRYRPLLRVGAIVAVVVAAKIGVHHAGWEVISINPLFSGVVAANVFLMGFLLSGVLADFKESERLPGELGVSLENLAQEVRGIRMAREEAEVGPCLRLVAELGRETLEWFHKRMRTGELLERVNDLTPQLAAMETWSQATLVARLKQEQSNLRRVVVRIETIRETAFVSSGYLLADLITIFLCLGLLFAKMKPLYESLFFVTIIAYFMIYLLLLIRDLDNPFGYYEASSGEDVSLEPLEATTERLAEIAKNEG